MLRKEFNPKASSSWFYLSLENMILHQNRWKGDDGGLGDALVRTSQAYIAYFNEILYKGIVSCFEKRYEYKNNIGSWYFKVKRYPSAGEDVSRDQVIGALTAIKIHNPDKIEYYASNLKIKLGDKLSSMMTPDMMIWVKSLYEKGIKSSKWFAIVSFYHVIMMIWTRILYQFINIKVVPQNEYIGGGKTSNWWRSNFRHKSYAVYLMAWQLYTTKDNWFKKKLMKSMLPLIDEDNLMLRLLFGGKVTVNEIIRFIPMNEMRWQDELIMPNKSSLKKLEPHQYQFNAIDSDLLWWYIEKHPEQLMT